MTRPVRAVPPVAVVAVGGVLATALVIAGLGVLGLPLLPRAAGQVDSAVVEAAVPTAQVSEAPAADVVASVLAPRGEPGYRGERAWTVNPSAPLARWCRADRSETAPLSRTRVYRVAGVGAVAVTASAYGAGQGVGAVAAFGERMRSCSSATFSAAAYGVDSGVGGSDADAVVGWVDPAGAGSSAAVLVWRRGDLVLSVLTAGSGTRQLAAIGTVFDARAVEALAPVCAFSAPSLDDVARSPWQERPYAGNLQPREVPLVYPPEVPSPTPSYPPEVTPVAVPQVVPSLPALPTVLPTGGPLEATPVPSPSPPSTPSPAPSALIVGEQVADPIGPGCGWAFTAQGAPGFDPGPAAAANAQRVSDAEAVLRDQDLAWQTAKVTYAREWAVYIEQAEAFSAYARAVSEALVREQDADYVAALQRWQDAKLGQELFLAEQESARVAYEQALAECAIPVVPGESPGATTSPLPSPTSTDGQTPVPVPSTSPTGPVGCPPVRPPILDQPAPPVPPSPEPPRR